MLNVKFWKKTQKLIKFNPLVPNTQQIFFFAPCGLMG